MRFEQKLTKKNYRRVLATHVVLEHSALLRVDQTGAVEVCTSYPDGVWNWTPYNSPLPQTAIALHTGRDIIKGNVVLVGDELLYVQDMVGGKVILSEKPNDQAETMRVVNRDVAQTWLQYHITTVVGALDVMNNDPSRIENAARQYVAERLSSVVDSAIANDSDLRAALAASGIGSVKIELLSQSETVNMLKKAQVDGVNRELDSLDDEPCDCEFCQARRAAGV